MARGVSVPGVGHGTIVKMRLVKSIFTSLAFALSVALSVALALWTGAATAQETSFLQVEAQPSLDKAMERARAYGGNFSDVQGFRVASGWYAVVLGPMTAEDAANRLVTLRAQNLVPQDAFIASAGELGARFWPVGDTTAAATGTSAPGADMAADTVPAVAEEETPKQALAAESALPQEERSALQDALKWYGFYAGASDGAIGKGTRKSMAAWQEANGYEATGVLTTAQRAELVGTYRGDKAEFGFEAVADAESGIQITLPLGLVAFDSYAPPFALYAAKPGSGLTVRLISQPGDVSALSGLYNVLQGLDVMPADGARALEDTSFTLRGKNASLESYAFAAADKGNVKGYLVTWTPALDAKIGRILPVIEASFQSLGSKSLDPGLVPLDDAVRRGLLAGLSAKMPKSSQSGLFVSADGAVVTTASAVAQCGSVTIERGTAADVVATDAVSGLVLLKPRTAIAPQAFAAFASVLPQKGAQVAAVGWSYGDRLPAPVLNPGILEEPKGLDGSGAQMQLALDILPGDVGGPVLDASGAVIGLVLAGAAKGPALPAGVALAQGDAAVTALMSQGAVPVTLSAASAPASPDALHAMGLGMTALVSCWE